MIKACELESEQKRAQTIDNRTGTFDSVNSGALESVTAVTEQMRSSSTSLSTLASNTVEKSVAVAAAAGQASSNVQTVAAVAEELGLQITSVVLIKQGALPRTTSGKLRRFACAQDYSPRTKFKVEIGLNPLDRGPLY